MRFGARVIVAAALLAGLTPGSGWAQSSTTGAIAGVVKDTTGAVLPGVTVEAASPALIEKVRSAVTDAQGNYKIVDLRPGTYSVTFSLPGFGSVKREGLELTTSFTASVNAELKVGSLEETVTVTGASPVVDVQNTRAQSVLSKDLLYALPNTQSLQGFATLTLGASLATASAQDVGGAKGEQSGAGNGFAVHGGRINDQRVMLDGMHFNSISIGGGAATNSTSYFNRVSVAETVLVVGGATAETETGGVLVNNVPRDGGNSLTGFYVLEETRGGLQANNLDSDLQSRGITTPAKIENIYDRGGSIGGPIKRDALWFYTGHRWWGTWTTRPGVYANSTQGTMVYTPDLSAPASRGATHRSNDVRLTWQATGKQKVTYLQQFQDTCKCGDALGLPYPPDGSQNGTYPQTLAQSTWSYPRTNRLLFDAGVTVFRSRIIVSRTGGSKPTDVPILELATGIMYNARGTAVTGNNNYTSPDGAGHHQSNGRAAVSYVTGSHALKLGFTMMQGWQTTDQQLNDIPGVGPVTYNFRNGVPVQFTQWRSPYSIKSRLSPNMGIYAQDQWTMKKLTLNLGVRYDKVHEFAPAVTLPAIPAFGVPELAFPKTTDGINWQDLSVRLGGAYDLFGNGKTAVKGYWGRYNQAASLGDGYAPGARIANSATRTWTDANRNFIPDCDLKTNAANGECGPISNQRFGQPAPATTIDPDTLHGWRKRPFNWQTSVSVQQELRPGTALTLGYFRTSYGNFTVTQNRAVSASDFQEYCVTAPTEARLGDVSGSRICGLYDVVPAQFGRVDNFVTFSSNLGDQSEVYNGIDIGINSRFGKGGVLQGGLNTGQTVLDNCDVVKNNPNVAFSAAGGNAPRTDAFCHQVVPFKAQTQYKFAVNYPLPVFGLRVSGTYQNLAPISQTTTVVYSNAVIAPSLGRNLSAGANATVTVPVMPPNTFFEGNRIQQFDLRLSKIFSFGKARLTANLDMYNLFNANNVTELTPAFGPNWLRPTQIMDGRLLKFGGQFQF